ncbi:6-carboxytetrahydropterin synthase [Rapidithrix thailandica]|uniref:6-carboxy-5,6,7,8-tetrahydropterin synthase n=1 Tax=Rapidithrix thailandica TaxID=413964 RepID=A0AAW9S5G7_9BACT
MVHICRKEHFNAAHKLYNEAWSKEKNEAMFGPCANENWHGHNFELIVTVKGTPHPDTGLVMDLKLLSKIIKKHIIEEVDHKNLNLDVSFLKGKMPSCEILVTEFWEILVREINAAAPEVQLHCIELFETRNNFVRYYGE